MRWCIPRPPEPRRGDGDRGNSGYLAGIRSIRVGKSAAMAAPLKLSVEAERIARDAIASPTEYVRDPAEFRRIQQSLLEAVAQVGRQ